MLPEAPRRPPLNAPAKVLLAILLVVLGVIAIPAMTSMGWPELSLIALALLLVTWPALAFYAWAKRRGDL